MGYVSRHAPRYTALMYRQGVTENDDDLLTYRDMARIAGVTAHTIRSYANRGRMPPADLRVDGKPLWRRATFTAWMQARRGQGWRGATRP